LLAAICFINGADGYFLHFLLRYHVFSLEKGPLAGGFWRHPFCNS